MDNLPLWILTAAYAGHILEEYTLDWRSTVRQMRDEIYNFLPQER